MPEPARAYRRNGSDAQPGSVGRVIAIIISAGLAWATVVTIVAWLLGRLLARG